MPFLFESVKLKKHKIWSYLYAVVKDMPIAVFIVCYPLCWIGSSGCICAQKMLNVFRKDAIYANDA
ncbi:TPA: hypothetical protein JI285_19560, partial [Acinetobacter baumannii]|nr:hypothetical protein [Acinetobacter baumannii]